ncbi:MAG: gluconate 2-dehydrogenase subunit 3 family protein [Pseudomonadales bacterium]|nr:gluconate 2-dehydrogenase subunit 3 family protein [Pseudomonadales bacterium]
MSQYSSPISRRQALARMAAMSAIISQPGNVYPAAPQTQTQTQKVSGEWPEITLSKIDARGYGTDPKLITPEPAPWPRTLNRELLNTLAVVSEEICPGSSAAGVPDVINEWVSAPYDQQQLDRKLLVPGIVWLDDRSLLRLKQPITALRSEDRVFLLNEIDLEANQNPTALSSQFFNRLRTLVTGAYFSSPEGGLELGYRGNTPIAGDYPGPSDEAMDHLGSLLEQLGLSLNPNQY